MTAELKLCSLRIKSKGLSLSSPQPRCILSLGPFSKLPAGKISPFWPWRPNTQATLHMMEMHITVHQAYKTFDPFAKKQSVLQNGLIFLAGVCKSFVYVVNATLLKKKAESVFQKHSCTYFAKVASNFLYCCRSFICWNAENTHFLP